MENRKILTANEKRVMEEAQKAAQRIVRKAADEQYVAASPLAQEART
jgi:hypothetical protein